MNINLLAVVTSPSIYHGCCTQKTFWEKNYTIGEFKAVDMKNCVRCNDSKHIEINVSDKYVILDISLKFVSLYKMIITSSESKNILGRSGKRLITSLGLNTKVRPKKCKNIGILLQLKVRY